MIKRVIEHDVYFAQLLQASVTLSIGLDESLWHIAPPAKYSASVILNPELLYARVPPTLAGFVLSFSNSANTDNHGRFGSCSWILWRFLEWIIVFAASAYLSATTVYVAEYAGINYGMQAALENILPHLIIVGDSRLAIQQCMGVLACNKESLQAM